MTLLSFFIFFTSFPIALLFQTTQRPNHVAHHELKAQHDAVKNPAVFQAYDCSHPVQKRDIGYLEEAPCTGTIEPRSVENVTFQILQKEEYLRVQGGKCGLTESSEVFHCGMHSHTAPPIFWASYERLPGRIDLQECKLLQTRQEYKDPLGERQTSLNPDQVHRFQYTRTGSIDQDANCRGGDLLRNGVSLTDVVDIRTAYLTFGTEDFLIKDGTVTLASNREILPCGASMRYCYTETATYYWGLPPRRCELAYTREVKGVLATDAQGDQVFMSTDGSLVRFVIEQQVSICGKLVHQTNYPDVYLFRIEEDKIHKPGYGRFERRIEGSEILLPSYIKNRDDYLYNHLLDLVAEEFAHVLGGACRARKRQQRLDFFLQHRDPALMTWFLGNATFATSSGEVIYVYRCRPLLVRAETSNVCYNGIPVRPLQNNDPLNNNATSLFMEPLTHRLSGQGIPIPCSQGYVAKYQNAFGSWTMVTPSILPATPPGDPFEGQLNAVERIFKDRLDWSEGGIYTEEELNDMHRYRDFPRVQNAISSAIGLQYAGEGITDHINANELFPDVSAWSTSFFGWIWDRLYDWGNICAAVIGFYTLAGMISTLVKWIIRLFIVRDFRGFFTTIAWSLCSGILILRKFKREEVSKKRPKGDTEEADSEMRPIKKVKKQAPAPPGTLTSPPPTAEGADELTSSAPPIYTGIYPSVKKKQAPPPPTF